MTPDEALALIDKLREKGAQVVEIGEIRVVFGPPRPRLVPDDDRDPQAEHAVAMAKRKGRSLEDRLLRPLGIKKDGSAA